MKRTLGKDSEQETTPTAEYSRQQEREATLRPVVSAIPMDSSSRSHAPRDVRYRDAATHDSGPQTSATETIQPDAQHVTPSPAILKATNATEIVDTRASGDEASGIAKHGEVPNRTVKWKTRFYMIIHVPRGEGIFKTCICKLDTGSQVNVLSLSIAKGLPIPIEPYSGPRVTPLGDPIQPVGQITLDWHVREKNKTYTTRFVVLDDKSSKGFDALLSDPTIGEIEFYQINDTVWYCGFE